MTQTLDKMNRLDRAFEMAAMYSTKPVITTLLAEQGKSEIVRNRRQSGHTTRQVNFAIDQLFDGKLVICLDHKEDGNNEAANRGLFERVLRRLQNEHPGLVDSEYLGYNQLYGFIYLKT